MIEIERECVCERERERKRERERVRERESVCESERERERESHGAVVRLWQQHKILKSLHGSPVNAANTIVNLLLKLCSVIRYKVY